MECARHLGHHEKTKCMNHGFKRKRRDATKSIANLFNKVIAENFPNLEKERIVQV
jgi:hypothetical protein